jgi:inorganic pyrophosphatase
MCRKFIGKRVRIVIDQPYGSFYEGIKYELNYGFVPDTIAPDGEGLDAYYLNSYEPLKEVAGVCIAIIHRLEDDDDKLVLVSKGVSLTDKEIEKAVHFREKLFKHVIVR